MYSCAICGFTGPFRDFRNNIGRLAKKCPDCRGDERQHDLARRNACLLDRLPPGLLSEVYELAGGRPVHPNARIMRKHVEETKQKLKDSPCFFEPPGSDLARSLQRHGWKWVWCERRGWQLTGSYRRTQKSTLPRPRVAPSPARVSGPQPAARPPRWGAPCPEPVARVWSEKYPLQPLLPSDPAHENAKLCTHDSHTVARTPSETVAFF